MTETDRLIREMVEEGIAPDIIAAHLVDLDVSTGVYEGCSTDLELAHNDYLTRATQLYEELVR